MPSNDYGILSPNFTTNKDTAVSDNESQIKASKDLSNTPQF